MRRCIWSSGSGMSSWAPYLSSSLCGGCSPFCLADSDFFSSTKQWARIILTSKDPLLYPYTQIRHQFDGDLKNHLQSILDQGQIGDWFVLYQLSKNSNYYFYREFIRELSKDLKQKPKQSLSGSSGTNYQSYIQSISVSAILTIRPSRPGPMAPPHSRVYLFFEYLYCIFSYSFSKNAKFCPENRENSPCTSFFPHFWPNVPVLSAPP